MMKALLLMTGFITALMSSAGALAERLEVFRWQSNSSSPVALVQGMMAAAKLHEAAGAHVGIYRMDVGASGQPTFDYVLRWDTGEAWAKTKESNNSEQWQTFWAQAAESPSGNLLMSVEGVNWDSSVKSSAFKDDGPFRVYVWQPNAGKTAAAYAAFMKAKEIHMRAGAKVDIYSEGVGGTGAIHYVVAFKDWASMAEFGDAMAVSEEFRFLQAAAAGSVTPVASIQGEPVYYTGR